MKWSDVIALGIGAVVGAVVLASMPYWRTERVSRVYVRAIW